MKDTELRCSVCDQPMVIVSHSFPGGSPRYQWRCPSEGFLDHWYREREMSVA